MKNFVQSVIGLVWFFSFWSFVAIKVAGTSFAAWSWFWILLSIVPIFSLAVKHFGL
jgi:hypothetical protein